MTASEWREHAQRVGLRILGIGAAEVITDSLRALVVFYGIGWQDRSRLVAEIAGNGLPLAFGLAIALELYGAGPLQGRPVLRWAVLLAGATLAVTMTCLLADTHFSSTLGIVASDRALRLRNWWKYCGVAIVTIVYLTRRRESLQAEQRQAAAALRLREARRRVAVLADRTGQSRLEPQTLLDCLIRAGHIYPVDPPRGDALLDRLTGYLRLTLDIGSNAAPTLAQEAELAAARVEVERGDADAPMRIHLAPCVAAAGFPPGLLASLVREWLHHPSAASPRALRLDAGQAGGVLTVRLTGPCPVPEAALQRASHSLDAFGGAQARISTDAHTLRLEIAHA